MRKINGEIETDLIESIIEELPNINDIHSTEHSLLIHGMGGQPRNFYRNLRTSTELELLWTGWSSNVWWTYLLSFIPGQAGLTKVLNRHNIDKHFMKIGAQSMCGLYFIPNELVNSVLEEVEKKRTTDIEHLLNGYANFFTLTIDFDYHGGERDREIFYHELTLGDGLSNELERTLTRTK